MQSVTGKVALLVVLLLLLHIPLGLIGGLVQERGASKAQATRDLAAAHSGPQTVIGPMLAVPYREHWLEPLKDDKGQVYRSEPRHRDATAWFAPRTLALDGKVEASKRQRGIFEVLFYSLTGRWRGSFDPVDVTELAREHTGSRLELLQPQLVFGLSDVRGIQGAPQLSVGGEQAAMEPGVPLAEARGWLARGVHAPLGAQAREAFKRGEPLTFELQAQLAGQERLAFAPVARDHRTALAINWPHLSFGGRFLPTERTETSGGFRARWAVSALVSDASRQVTGAMQSTQLDTFDVALIEPQNAYSLSDRAVKYAVLIISLVLMAAFLFELFARLNLHPVQYGLVGLSIALFFLLLLALSEKLAFGLAYGVAASASVLVLGVYFSAALGGLGRGLGLAAFVGVLYAALYGLLVSEDNALLMGSLLLFAMLSALMLGTRRIDWHALSAQLAAGGGKSQGASDVTPV